MQKRLNAVIHDFELLKNKKILVACSTGIDSMVLLDLCLKYLNKENIGIAHINHKKRIESETEEEYIKNFAGKENLNIYIKHLSLNNDSNFQSWARKERYDFFKEIVKTYKYDYVLLAHHADDNLETILMRLLKSSSLKGYAGIEQLTTYQGINIYRPLLKVDKEFISWYAKENNIIYFNDCSNEEDDYQRNRIRHNIVPLLKLENPNLIDAVNNYSNTLLEADKVLEEKLNLFIKTKVLIHNNNNVIVKEFDYDEFVKESIFLKEQILFRLTKEIGLSKKTILELINQLSQKQKINNKVSDELSVIKEYGKVKIIIGKLIIPCFKVNVEQEGLIDLPNGLSLYVERFNSLKKENNNKICYNIKRLFVPSFPVTLRTKEEGDKIKLNSGTISLSDVLTNIKLNYLDRLNTIVVENNEQIINLLIYNQIEEDKNGGN